ncbi:MAG: hypothetical protein EA405_13990 [Rhodospirillales bacterium]|nr:MAG: hypothetical protein EA405_13990 [Rhodospirillales bacterium]
MVVIPGWGRSDPDFAKRAQMGALVGLLVMRAGEPRLNAPCGAHEIVGKGEARALAGESVGESPSMVVGPATGDAAPPGDDSLFNGHDPVEVDD